MLKFILGRLAQVLLVISLLSVVCYSLLSVMPGDPIDVMMAANPGISAAAAEQLREIYGANTPVWRKYVEWASNFIRGDLGYSRTYSLPVSEIIGARLANTFLLSFFALLLALSVALPIGVLCGLDPNSRFSLAFTFLSVVGISVPIFWTGIILITVFSVHFGILPAGGAYGLDQADLSFFAAALDRGKHLVLPVITLSSLSLGRFFRYAKESMRDVVATDYVRTARAKGLSEWSVILKHGLRNALIPLITVIALSFSTIFSGALVTETVFSYQGMGKLTYDAIQSNDFNVAMVAVMISSAMILLMNLLADTLYALVDPRIVVSNGK